MTLCTYYASWKHRLAYSYWNSHFWLFVSRQSLLLPYAKIKHSINISGCSKSAQWQNRHITLIMSFTHSSLHLVEEGSRCSTARLVRQYWRRLRQQFQFCFFFFKSHGDVFAMQLCCLLWDHTYRSCVQCVTWLFDYHCWHQVLGCVWFYGVALQLRLPHLLWEKKKATMGVCCSGDCC